MSIPAAGTDSSAATEPVPASEFRFLMSTFPAGVAVVTAPGQDGRPFGTTCTAISSVTVSPPTLLVCLQRSSRTLTALNRAGSFAVNLLGGHGRAVAQTFASREPNRFRSVSWTASPGSGGPHLEQDSHAIADCRVAGSLLIADHIVVFGEVFRVTRQDTAQARPLVYGMREYWSLGRSGAVPEHAAASPASEDSESLT